MTQLKSVPTPGKKARKPQAMRYIRRGRGIDQAWTVAIQRVNKTWNKHFADASYGGKAKALTAAKAWRDNVVGNITGPAYRLWKREIRRIDNTSGVVGVSRGIRPHRSGDPDRAWHHWQASWKDLDGKLRQRCFGVRKYGEQCAKDLATLARNAGLADVASEAALRALLATKPEPVPKPIASKYKPGSMRYINRDNSGRCDAWKVTIKRMPHAWTASFSDRVYGGKQQALAKARAWRDALLTRIDQPGQPKAQPLSPAARRNIMEELALELDLRSGRSWRAGAL